MIINYPLSTEKTIRLMESQNTLIFMVDLKATKAQVKAEIEKMFNVKVASVNTSIGPDEKKKAYVRFAPESPAIDVATKLGLL
jgi:ribosomal protein uL23